MGKIAIVGATGHFGGKAIDFLLKGGIKPSDIIALYRNESKAAPLKEKGLEIRLADYQSGQYPPSVFDGADKLLFIPGNDIENVKQKSEFGMENVHVATEHAIKATGIPYTFLRNTFYTEYFLTEKDLKQAVDTGVLETLSQGKKINFVTREDMAHAAAAVLLSPQDHLNKTYDITAPKAYSYQEIAEILTEITGKPVKTQETTIEKRVAFLDSIGVPKQFQLFDGVLSQAKFARGWAEGTSSALADLIGKDTIKSPKQIIKEIFA
ncbi:hypothetical protein PIROE2DRAFT_57892 [Piromyces sp. E2]|nr:hypothetical protein PIROE2DRAFT_57892 [Piromyces sp. E2]|eukprot:OUM68673.1 hypothetical protein PIROE2DRAFT_57892 [Piromyces sp. E2]